MSAYLKSLKLHVYLTTTKKSYLDNDKHIEANTQALVELRHTLSKDQFSLISHCDSAFAEWNTLTSLTEQMTYVLKKESSGDESDQACFMVQGIDSLEVNSDTQLDDCASSSCKDNMNAHALNEKLFENLLSKYKLLKKKSFKLKEENENLSLKLDMILQERVEISSERDSLKTQLDLALKEKK